jgi:hypothetical protein
MNNARYILFPILLFLSLQVSTAEEIKVNGGGGELTIRAAGRQAVRVTLKPAGFAGEFPYTSALADLPYAAPAIRLTAIRSVVKKSG